MIVGLFFLFIPSVKCTKCKRDTLATLFLLTLHTLSVKCIKCKQDTW